MAQTISYEVGLAFLVIRIFLNLGTKSLRVRVIGGAASLVWALPVLGLWAVSCVAELNRTPFDFAEGESELVSGFNIEYGSVKFAIIFMAEYAMIITLSLLTAVLLLPGAGLRLRRAVLGVGLAGGVI